METPNTESDASNEHPSGSVGVGVSVGQSSSTKNTRKDSEEIFSLTNLDLPSLPSDVGQSVERYSFETNFEFSNKEFSFEQQCEEIIKEITRKDLSDSNIPSFEQQIEGITALKKRDICKEYVTKLEEAHYHAGNRLDDKKKNIHDLNKEILRMNYKNWILL